MRELFDALGHYAGTSADATAFDDGTTRLSYGALARRVAALADELGALEHRPATIGLLGSHRVDWIVGQLAGWYAGKTVVPLPAFFSLAQLRHIVGDAGIGHLLVTADMADTAACLDLPVTEITAREAGSAPAEQPAGGQIIYTSGSTGQPKGVLLRGGQIVWSAQALSLCIAARDDDRYLSVLPLPLLLETICAVVIPILAGASVRLASSATFDGLNGQKIAESVAQHRPSCMVLVPQLLARWVAELRETGGRAPESLRLVAVGGAAVPPQLAAQAWRHGIPVHEGYGLSECGSVVALNRPGERKPGTVGRPLPGLDVRIDGGEIVVEGPSVMQRYLHGAPASSVWRTGDVGEIDADGALTVRGRLDNVIVTSTGRNISPDWIEALIAADPRVAYCLVTHFGGPHLAAILVPALRSERWFAQAAPKDLASLVADGCRDVPDYAVPRQIAVVSQNDLAASGVLAGGLGARRAALLDACMALLWVRTGTAPAAPRQVFG